MRNNNVFLLMGKKKKNKMHKYNITIRGYFSRHYVYTVGIMLPTANKIKKKKDIELKYI
jgi:hypothetical protein